MLRALPTPGGPPMVVVLSATSGESQGVNAFVAGVSADGRAVVTRPIAPVSVQPDRALELWAVPPQGAPRSLGLISEKSASVVQRGRVPAGTAALAVSLEPPGGSPTGVPTGPVLYVGKLSS
jgi:anti-sigma-K factor RskA